MRSTSIVLDFPRQDRCDAADWMTTCDAVIAAAKATGAVAGIVASHWRKHAGRRRRYR